MRARDDGLVHVFRMLSSMRAKLRLVVLTRNVQTGSYQLLLDVEMVPNAGKTSVETFVCAQQCSCSQSMNIPSIPAKSGK